MSQSNGTRVILIALTLFGSFAIGANLSVGLHEFGHALGIWFGGEQVTGFYWHPFRPSMVHFTFDRLTQRRAFFLYAWGGVVGGTFFSLALLGSAFLVRRGSAWWLIAFMTATLGLAVNGLYLFLGAIDPFGDAAALVYGLGHSRALLFVLGLPLVLGFLYLFPQVLGALGLKRADGFGYWLLVTEAGFLLYPMLMIFYTVVTDRGSSSLPQLLVVGLEYLGSFAVLCAGATALAYRGADTPGKTTVVPCWLRAWILLALAGLLVLTELVMVGIGFPSAIR